MFIISNAERTENLAKLRQVASSGSGCGVMTLTTSRRDGKVACIGAREGSNKTSTGNLKRIHFQDHDTYVIILKWTLKQSRKLDIGFTSIMLWFCNGFCGHGNELSGSIKGTRGGFL